MTTLEFLKELAIPRNYAGYKQLVTAVELAAEDSDRVLNVYRDIYGAVADKHGVTASSVEKNLRTVLHAAWQRSTGTRKKFEQYAGYQCQRQPTTSEFLDVASGCVDMPGWDME